MNKKLTVLELCAGGGGQFLGLESAGFHCVGAVEIEREYCNTLKTNRPKLNIINCDLKSFIAKPYVGVDLVAGGVPCPPFSIAGNQLGKNDERDLFPYAIKTIQNTSPKAVIIENVPGLASSKFNSYRKEILDSLSKLGYFSDWKILNASEYGVPQLRPRFILIAMKKKLYPFFQWPKTNILKKTVGETLYDLMALNGWQGAMKWASKANGIAPTIVGGSKKHGGPDLGPTRARLQWEKLGVDGRGIADDSPESNFPENGLPRLTVRMAARIQGFSDSWQFPGKKTVSYRQVGNAFPPAVAQSVGHQIIKAFNCYEN